ncbi:MAG: nickel pincer cofactor biosynthesis protein LarB [Clostridiales bacterium]|nr:nickel pincer cofactor biosynthesis protein LarB [Clostridiales bacterium]
MNEGYKDLGFAKLDTDRKARTGFAEVVFCEGKEEDYLVKIYKTLLEENGEVFGTRASSAQYEAVKAVIPEVSYDKTSRILKVSKTDKILIGNIAVCTAGTADIPVAEEAAQTAEYFGGKVNRFYDIGVSGLHRLMAVKDQIAQANCVIAVAGMEGALASVLGGLVSNPVIGVPTSTGYGVGAGGKTALYAMLSTCANGVATVNIDNGYGAGYIATQINRLAAGAQDKE